jgi:hypothetical protein
MPGQRKTIGQLMDVVLQERAAGVDYTEAETDAAVQRLRARFAEVRAASPLRHHVTAAIASLPAERRDGWLRGTQAALRVVLSEARRGSRILGEAARDILPLRADAWEFAAADGAATRGETGSETGTETGDRRRADSVPAENMPALQVVVDDAGAERRLIATIRDFPSERTPPVLLIVPDGSGTDTSVPIEVDAEVIAATPGRRLRYEATLPAGGYSIFFGNAREDSPREDTDPGQVP